jgi:hypothetical protein
MNGGLLRKLALSYAIGDAPAGSLDAEFLKQDSARGTGAVQQQTILVNAP